MTENEKRTYAVPQLEEINCKVERGFAGSNAGVAGSNGFGATRSGYNTSPSGTEYVWN